MTRREKLVVVLFVFYVLAAQAWHVGAAPQKTLEQRVSDLEDQVSDLEIEVDDLRFGY